jgi:D-alanine-D-alanine ligase
MVFEALRRAGVDAVKFDPVEDDFVYHLKESAVQQVFITLHGRGGEDGTMQGFLDTLNLPYTGSGVAASALAMNKYHTKQVWRGAGLPTPASVLLNADSDWQAVVADLGLPLMVKPVHEGSSVGMSKVESAQQLQTAWQNAAGIDSQVMAEQFIQGGEYTASILDTQALPLIRLETPRGFYDYEAKYHADTTQYHCPCGLSAEQENRLQDLALRAFQVLGASGWGRVDIMLDAAQNPWLLELNTIPGMTDHSLVPIAAQAAGIDYDTLVMKVLATAV